MFEVRDLENNTLFVGKAKEVAKWLNRSPATVCRAARKNKVIKIIKNSYRIVKKPKEKKKRGATFNVFQNGQQIASNLTAREISKQFYMERTTVYYCLHRCGKTRDGYSFEVVR